MIHFNSNRTLIYLTLSRMARCVCQLVERKGGDTQKSNKNLLHLLNVLDADFNKLVASQGSLNPQQNKKFYDDS
jgi:hypothetical protein